MNVLVTGSSGRVGRTLIAALRERGHTTRGLDLAAPRSLSTDGDAPSPAVDAGPDVFVAGSLGDPTALDQALDGANAIVHLAAFMSWDPRHAQRVFEANVDGTFALLNAARDRGVQRFVFGSSGEVYPELAPSYLPIDERHPTRPTSTYGMSKLVGEEMVWQWARTTGAPTCVLRFAHTQAAHELLDPESFFSGPRFYVHAKLRQLRTFPASPAVDASISALADVAGARESHYIGCDAEGAPYRMAICDVRDLVQGLVLGLEHDDAPGETFNIGPTASVDFDELVPHLASITGMPVHRVRLHTTPYRYDTSIAKAQRVLGYRPNHDPFSMAAEAAETTPRVAAGASSTFPGAER